MENGIGRQRVLLAAGLAAVVAGSGFAVDAWADERVERAVERMALERYGLTLSYEESSRGPGDAVVLSGVTLVPATPLDDFEIARAEEVTISGVEERPDEAFTFEGLDVKDLSIDFGEAGALSLAEGRFDGLDTAVLAWLFREDGVGAEQAFPDDARIGEFDLRGLEARYVIPDGHQNLRLARVSGEEIARGRIGGLRLEDMTWSASGAAVEEVTRIALAGLEVADVQISALLDDPAARRIFDRSEDDRLGRGVIRRLEVEGLADTIMVEAAGWEDRVDADRVSTTRFFAESLRVPIDELTALPYGARLRDVVADTLRFSTEVSVVIDPKREALRIDPLVVRALDLGGLEMTVAFDDFPNVVPGEEMLEAMINARLAGAQLSYREDGLLQALMEQGAAERDLSLEQFRAEIRETIREQDFVDAATREELLRFLEDPYRLTLQLAPERPPSFAEILGMALIAPDQIRGILNMRIHAEESP